MFKNYLITAVRDIRRHKLYAFINIFGLALVIALLTVSYQAVKAARGNPVDSLRYE